MGRRSKAMQSWLQNLGEALKSQRAWVDDVTWLTSDEDENLSEDVAIVDISTQSTTELNFIEQYWDAAKFHYWSTPKTSDINKMEQNIIACLQEIPQLQILRYVILFLAQKSSFKHAPYTCSVRPEGSEKNRYKFLTLNVNNYKDKHWKKSLENVVNWCKTWQKIKDLWPLSVMISNGS